MRSPRDGSKPRALTNARWRKGEPLSTKCMLRMVVGFVKMVPASVEVSVTRTHCAGLSVYCVTCVGVRFHVPVSNVCATVGAMSTAAVGLPPTGTLAQVPSEGSPLLAIVNVAFTSCAVTSVPALDE